MLIIYDIVSNRRRNKFAKCLNGYGFRVQKSAFEALIEKRLFLKLQKEIPQLIDPSADSVRIYRMTGYGEVDLYGVNTEIKADDIMIL
ncbi:CRISPR-associated endonuclease Cas2 [Oribacterium sp. oral taxon 078]|uniref:CRISPR-associated endonuclease Cas2 n=1 Tax=Oribacterium sp. oral taxon 078 TaxID=652706 RepID=UPI0002E2B2A0|nr:CRISPR-associated endonuclease Cas2 [Oribacterium sp. oral taxon 078]